MGNNTEKSFEKSFEELSLDDLKTMYNDYYSKKEPKEEKEESRDLTSFYGSHMKYVIVRTYSAGVFAGYLHKKVDKEVELKYARRLWQWSGAASLSHLSQEGTKNPDSCKFPCEVEKVILTEAIEILNVTEKARKSIAGVKIWTA